MEKANVESVICCLPQIKCAQTRTCRLMISHESHLFLCVSAHTHSLDFIEKLEQIFLDKNKLDKKNVFFGRRGRRKELNDL